MPGVPMEPTAPAAPTLSPAVEALLSAFEAVAGRIPADLPGPVALADTAALLGLGERLRAVTLGHVADVDARQLHTADGSPSTSSWIAALQTSVPAGELALAKRLSGMPCLASAVESGLLSVAVAAKLAGALVKAKRHLDRPDGRIDGQDGEAVLTAVLLDGVRQLVCEALGGLADDDPRLLALVRRLGEVAAAPAPQLARLEAGFVLLAAHLEPAQLPGALTRLLDALVPSALERAAEDQHARRGFSLARHTDGSGWYVRAGELDLETGELLHTVLSAELAVDPDNPVDTAAFGRARQDGWTAADGADGLPGLAPAPAAGQASVGEAIGDGPSDDGPSDDGPSGGCPGPRSLAQRRHDALRNALRRYLASGAVGLRSKTVPQIGVTLGLDALHGAPGSLGPVAASGAVLPRSLVRRWWCDSAVTRFVLSLGGKVLKTSHTTRTLKPHERRAKTVETGGWCQGAGCHRGPGHTLIPHHVDPWATSRTTSLRDTALLCEQTHHELHTGRTIRLKDGRWLNAQGWCADPRSSG